MNSFLRANDNGDQGEDDEDDEDEDEDEDSSPVEKTRQSNDVKE